MLIKNCVKILSQSKDYILLENFSALHFFRAISWKHCELFFFSLHFSPKNCNIGSSIAKTVYMHFQRHTKYEIPINKTNISKLHGWDRDLFWWLSYNLLRHVWCKLGFIAVKVFYRIWSFQAVSTKKVTLFSRRFCQNTFCLIVIIRPLYVPLLSPGDDWEIKFLPSSSRWLVPG